MRTKLASLFHFAWCVAVSAAQVTTMRTPNGGIQPQAAVDERGTVHLIYYKGDPGGGDVFYVRQDAGASEFSKPIRVNSQPGSAIAAGSIRGAQLAVGRSNRVHVVWNGGKGAKKVMVGDKAVTPLLYTRQNDAGGAFERERNLLTKNAGLDGGSAVAADSVGNVYVFWHGSAPDNTANEAGRAVFVARSTDDGAAFAPEVPAIAQRLGACACCGMKAFADERGAVYVLYRAATANTERGETLLVSKRAGAPFEVAFADPWKAMQCPMSSASISAAPNGVLAAWETGDAVKFARIDRDTSDVPKPRAPFKGPKRKHPVVVGNTRGETLFVWSEGTAWAKGGAVAWQVFGADNTLPSDTGRAEGLPVWGLATAYAKSNGNFVVIY